MKPMKVFICLVLSMAVIYGCTKTNDDNQPVVSNQDRLFMTQASYGNWAEINAGQLAAIHSNNDSVKMFGQMMVNDHSMAQEDLDTLGSQWSIGLPAAADSAQQQQREQLAALSGHTFDTAYIRAQIVSHQQAIDLFQSELDSGQNQQLKDYVNKYLPVIKMHLQKADSIWDILGP